MNEEVKRDVKELQETTVDAVIIADLGPASTTCSTTPSAR
jgi:collagenase-like PrtC family protease